MINRFSNFIFDFLSLIAPGFMLIFLLFLLLLGVDPNGNTDHAELTAIFTIAEAIKTAWTTDKASVYSWVVLSVVLVSAYIIGHVLKVISKLFYSIMKDIFDNGLFFFFFFLDSFGRRSQVRIL